MGVRGAEAIRFNEMAGSLRESGPSIALQACRTAKTRSESASATAGEPSGCWHA